MEFIRVFTKSSCNHQFIIKVVFPSRVRVTYSLNTENITINRWRLQLIIFFHIKYFFFFLEKFYLRKKISLEICNIRKYTCIPTYCLNITFCFFFFLVFKLLLKRAFRSKSSYITLRHDNWTFDLFKPIF